MINLTSIQSKRAKEIVETTERRIFMQEPLPKVMYEE